MQTLTEYLNILITLLAIVDPLGAIPIFIGLTASQTPRAQRMTAVITGVSVGLVLIFSALVGEKILQLFGINIGSFRIAGGLLLLLMGIAMMNAQEGYRVRQAEQAEASEKENVAVVPLAIPLLSGPGAISSMIIYAHRSPDWRHVGMLNLAAVAVAIITVLSLWLAQPIARAVGRTGLNILIRLMGLILSAAAVQFIVNGLLQLFPILSRP